MVTSISSAILVLYIYTEKRAILILRKKNLKQVKDQFFQAIFFSCPSDIFYQPRIFLSIFLLETRNDSKKFFLTFG